MSDKLAWETARADWAEAQWDATARRLGRVRELMDYIESFTGRGAYVPSDRLRRILDGEDA